jgi:hypothetical protein
MLDTLYTAEVTEALLKMVRDSPQAFSVLARARMPMTLAFTPTSNTKAREKEVEAIRIAHGYIHPGIHPPFRFR